MHPRTPAKVAALRVLAVPLARRKRQEGGKPGERNETGEGNRTDGVSLAGAHAGADRAPVATGGDGRGVGDA